MVFSCGFMILIIGILDYPVSISLWQNVTVDPSGWWHETLLIFLGYLVALDLTYWWENRWQTRLVLRRVERKKEG